MVYFLYRDFLISRLSYSGGSFIVIQRGGYVQGVSIPEGRGLNMSRGDRR